MPLCSVGTKPFLPNKGEKVVVLVEFYQLFVKNKGTDGFKVLGACVSCGNYCLSKISMIIKLIISESKFYNSDGIGKKLRVNLSNS